MYDDVNHTEGLCTTQVRHHPILLWVHAVYFLLKMWWWCVNNLPESGRAWHIFMDLKVIVQTVEILPVTSLAVLTEIAVTSRWLEPKCRWQQLANLNSVRYLQLRSGTARVGIWLTRCVHWTLSTPLFWQSSTRLFANSLQTRLDCFANSQSVFLTLFNSCNSQVVWCRKERFSHRTGLNRRSFLDSLCTRSRLHCSGLSLMWYLWHIKKYDDSNHTEGVHNPGTPPDPSCSVYMLCLLWWHVNNLLDSCCARYILMNLRVIVRMVEILQVTSLAVLAEIAVASRLAWPTLVRTKF